MSTDLAHGTEGKGPGGLGSRLGDTATRLLSWRITMVSDPTTFDRWRWLRRNAHRGERTLDAGCGSGAFSIYLAHIGNDVTGVNWDQQASDAATRRARSVGVDQIRFQPGDLRELERFGPGLGQFQQIVCLEVIEHIRDDAKLLRDLAARLEPGGRLLLTTPAADHKPLYREHLSEVEDGGHVHYGFSDARLREISEDAGLEVVAQEHFCGIVGQGIFNLQRRLGRRLGVAPAALVGMLLIPAMALDRPLSRLARRPGLHVSIIARRPAGAAA